MITAIRNRISQLIRGKNRVKVYTFLGVAAMLLILLSEILPSSDTSKKKENPVTDKTADASAHKAETEKKLAEMLSDIKDVGKAEVILSVEGSEEYIYAEDVSSDRASRDADSSEKSQSKLVLTEQSGSKAPLVKKVLMPKFNGALVICDGGDSLSVKERVIKAVSAALDLPISKICVECRIS